MIRAVVDTNVLVTGNRRDFPEPFYGTAAVVNARQLLDRLADGALGL